MNTERLFIRIISTNVLLDPVNVCDICFFPLFTTICLPLWRSPFVSTMLVGAYAGVLSIWPAPYPHQLSDCDKLLIIRLVTRNYIKTKLLVNAEVVRLMCSTEHTSLRGKLIKTNRLTKLIRNIYVNVMFVSVPPICNAGEQGQRYKRVLAWDGDTVSCEE